MKFCCFGLCFWTSSTTSEIASTRELIWVREFALPGEFGGDKDNGWKDGLYGRDRWGTFNLRRGEVGETKDKRRGGPLQNTWTAKYNNTLLLPCWKPENTIRHILHIVKDTIVFNYITELMLPYDIDAFHWSPFKSLGNKEERQGNPSYHNASTSSNIHLDDE